MKSSRVFKSSLFILTVKISLWLGSTLSYGETQFYIKRIFATADKLGQLHIGFNKPCSSTFLGFVILPYQTDGLKIGAVIEKKLDNCTGLSHFQSFPLPEIDLKKYPMVSSFDPQKLRGKPTFTEVMDIRKTKEGSRSDLTVVYRNSCHPSLGTFITRRGQREIQIGYMELKRNKKHLSAPPSWKLLI